LAFDFRQVEYSKTEGFEEYGWSPTGAVKALDGVICKYYLWVHNTESKKIPLRVGYTYNTNPLNRN
jgi:long-chain fatty acid transport protein